MAENVHYLFNDQLRRNHRPCGKAAQGHIRARERGTQVALPPMTRKQAVDLTRKTAKDSLIRDAYLAVQKDTWRVSPDPGEVLFFRVRRDLSIIREQTSNQEVLPFDDLGFLDELVSFDDPWTGICRNQKCKRRLPVIMSWHLFDTGHSLKKFQLHCPACLRTWKARDSIRK